MNECKKMKKVSLLLGTLLLLMATTSSPSRASQESIQIPQGNAIVVDGKIGADEWKGSLVQKVAGGGELRLMHDGPHLLIGLKAPSDGLTHICVSDGKDIYV